MSDERFYILFGLMVLTLVVLVAVELVGFYVLRGYLREAAAVLDMAKDYYDLGRSNHSDAKAVMKRLETHTETVSAEVAKAVAPVPEKTATRVAAKLEEIKASESGTLKAVQPRREGPK